MLTPKERAAVSKNAAKAIAAYEKHNVQIDSHSLESLEEMIYGPRGWVAVCECSGPEGDYADGFSGSVEFFGSTKKDAYDQWLDHHNEHV